MKSPNVWACMLSVSLAGCATAPGAPPEPLISVQLRGTSVEVQNFIEERFRKNSGSGFRVENATDRAITFKGDCMNVPDMNAFKCSLIMMAVGNSRWDGPYAVIAFRTAEIRGVVNLTVSSEWCATNAFGKSDSGQTVSVAKRRPATQDGAASESEVRPLRESRCGLPLRPLL